MSELERALIIAFFIILAGVIVAWRFLDVVSDFIAWLGKLTEFFSGVMRGLSRPQKFNILVDILILIWLVVNANSLRGNADYLLVSGLVALSIIVACLFIAFFRRAV